jgi:hypothetical protein
VAISNGRLLGLDNGRVWFRWRDSQDHNQDTTESNYVLAELGAAWGRDVATFPLLARGATYSDVPSPLNERHSVSLESQENCLELIESVCAKTTLKRREGSGILGKMAHAARVLADAAKGNLGQAAKVR